MVTGREGGGEMLLRTRLTAAREQLPISLQEGPLHPSCPALTQKMRPESKHRNTSAGRIMEDAVGRKVGCP